MPLCLGTLGSVRDEDPELRVVCAARPDLRAVDHVLVAIALGAGGEAGQVGPGVGFAEQLTPELVAAQDGRQETLLLLSVPANKIVGAAHPIPIGLFGSTTPAALQLVFDDQLVHRVGVESPRRWPVRHHVAGLGELTSGRVAVGGQPLAYREPARIVVGRQVEIHHISSISASGISTTRARSHSPRLLAWASCRVEAATPSSKIPWTTKFRERMFGSR